MIDAQVQVTPASPRTNVGHAIQLTANILNTTDQRVAWSIAEGNTGGAITQDGRYTPPSTANTYHVIATCTAHPQKAMTVSVVVTDIRIAITPLERTVNVNGQLPLSATITGSVIPAVSWQVREGVLGGQITADGHYTAPPIAGTYHIIATSLEDPTVSVEIPITVTSMQVVGEIN